MKTPDWLKTLLKQNGAEDPIGYLASNSRSFRFATRFLPSVQAREIAEVYAFCRFTDDLVDKETQLSIPLLHERLDEWECLARLAFMGNTTGVPLLDAPMSRMAEQGIRFSYVEELMEGMRMDLEPRQYGTIRELEQYTYRVAGVVGKWLTELSGVKNPWALERAADLGHAMQLTNILRDVGEDWEKGRLYLPLDALKRHGLSQKDIGAISVAKSAIPLAYKHLMEDLLGMAEKRYQMAFQGIPSLPEYFQRPVLVAALVYREIHSALRQNKYDNFKLRAHSSGTAKVTIGLRAFWLLPCIRDLFPASETTPRIKELAYEY